MKIEQTTTLNELEMELGKLGAQICQVSFMPDGQLRCDVADRSWARGTGHGGTIAEAVNAALENLRSEITTLLAAAPKAVSLTK